MPSKYNDPKKKSVCNISSTSGPDFGDLGTQDQILIDAKILSLVLSEALKNPQKMDVSGELKKFAHDTRATFSHEVKDRRKLWGATANAKICPIAKKKNSYLSLSRAERIIVDATVLRLLLGTSVEVIDNQDISDFILKERHNCAKHATFLRPKSL